MLCKFYENTVCVQIFLAGLIFRECLEGEGEGFVILFLRKPILREDFVNRVGYYCSNHTAREVLVHLLSNLSS